MSALLKLRDYQTEAIAELHRRWDAGDTRVPMVLATGLGKGHPLETEVPTPRGWRRWGDLEVGDSVFGRDGSSTEVLEVYDRGVLETYRVTFSDESSVLVDGDHIWTVRDSSQRPRAWGNLETRDLARAELKLERGYRFHVPMTSPLEREPLELPLDPYVVGSLISNGSMTRTGTQLTTPDLEAAARVSSATQCNKIKDSDSSICDRYSLPGLTGITRALGMRVGSLEKRIPATYLEGSLEQRTALLNGLMDGDGSARDSSRRGVSYFTSSAGLARDVSELVTSLGGTGVVKRYDRPRGTEYAVRILLPSSISPFSTGRKDGAGSSSTRNLQPKRAIVSVALEGSSPIRCIRVAARDSLYLITRQHIVTHNTVIFAHLIADWTQANAGKRVMVLVHTDELVQQAYKKIKDTAPGLKVGIVKAERNEVTARVIVASVQSLRSAKRRSQIRNVGLIIVDECFPAGTMVGDKRIEDLKPGDVVPSWDEKTGETVMRPVVRLMKKAPSAMVRVSMSDGTFFACTPNHPILTSNGWQLAGWLSPGESVVSFTHDATATGDVHRVRELPHLDDQGKDRHLSAHWTHLLPGSVPGCVGGEGSIGQDGPNEPQARVGAHEGTQPDGASGSASEDDGHTEGDRAQAELAWREWDTSPGAASADGSVSRLAHRGHRRTGGRGASVSLQDRRSAPDDEGSGGGGWGIPLLTGAPVLRSTPGRTAVTTRVVDVQVLEPGSDGTYGGVCPDGLVYNIEVADTHTYLIDDGVVVHNCHHATAATYRAILDHYGAFDTSVCPTCIAEIGLGDCMRCGYRKPQVAGFTATLARGDRAKLSDIWQECTFKRGISFGIRRGYLLDVRGKRIVIPDMDLGNVSKSGGDYAEGSLAAELDRSLAPSIVAAAYVEHAAARKGLGFAPTVESAYHFAEAFQEAGIPSAVVHGGTPREERRLILKRLHEGDIQVVWNCGVLTEGFDEPTVSCVVMARPTKSAPLYQQIVGRGLRPDLSLPAAERGDCLVLDVVGASGRHDLRTLVDLSERRDDLTAEDIEDLSLIELEDSIAEAEGESGEITVEEYYGETAVQEFDPLNRTGIGAWLKTAGGTYFLPVSVGKGGAGAYVLIVESQETPGAYDVAWLAQSPGRPFNGGMGDLTEHRGLPLDMACSWAEEVLEELGGQEALLLAGAKKRWRKDPSSDAQKAWAARRGLDIEGMRKGEVADLRSVIDASRRIDPVVEFMKQARETVTPREDDPGHE